MSLFTSLHRKNDPISTLRTKLGRTEFNKQLQTAMAVACGGEIPKGVTFTYLKPTRWGHKIALSTIFVVNIPDRSGEETPRVVTTNSKLWIPLTALQKSSIRTLTEITGHVNSDYWAIEPKLVYLPSPSSWNGLQRTPTWIGEPVVRTEKKLSRTKSRQFLRYTGQDVYGNLHRDQLKQAHQGLTYLARTACLS